MESGSEFPPFHASCVDPDFIKSCEALIYRNLPIAPAKEGILRKS